MKIDFKGLFEGIKNSVFPAKEIKEQIEQTAKDRIAICEGCEFYSPNSPNKVIGIRPDVHCINCGCNLHWKTRCLSCACPMDKWKAYITESEEKVLTEQIRASEKSNP